MTVVAYGARGEPAVQRVWRPGWALEIDAIVGALRAGRGDPSQRRLAPGAWAKAFALHGEPVTLLLRSRSAMGEVEARAWGPGAEAALELVPALLGAHDDPSGFTPRREHHALVEAYRRHLGWRVPASGLVMDTAVWVALGQLVTGIEAMAGYCTLLRRFGMPAPGPSEGPTAGMMVPPSATTWLRLTDAEWLRAGVDASRRAVVREVARRITSLERTLTWSDAEKVDAAWQSLRGVGVWTSAEVRQRTHGHADAFSFRDYHVAKNVTWALTGEVLGDAECEELLEPYRGHRFRVQRLLELEGVRRPRRAPRMAPPAHLPRTFTARPRRPARR